ncbi:hypothetical protein VTJ04DRAFT_2652 [Mycothermus thermophilus]|uniref:uncharacterized protein n=1 Tax=Humicola insolens TaxID=85995 RepID=UPI00374356E3
MILLLLHGPSCAIPSTRHRTASVLVNGSITTRTSAWRIASLFSSERSEGNGNAPSYSFSWSVPLQPRPPQSTTRTNHQSLRPSLVSCRNAAHAAVADFSTLSTLRNPWLVSRCRRTICVTIGSSTHPPAANLAFAERLFRPQITILVTSHHWLP